MNKQEVLRYARVCQGSYPGEDFPSDIDIDIVDEYVFTKTDTQAFIFSLKNETIVSFPGTDITSKKDIVTDFRFIPRVHPFLNKKSKVRVARGFHDAEKDCREELLKRVEKLGRPVTCIGHSLGAALATLFAVDVQYNTYLPVRGVVWGSPRVFNRAGVASFNKRVPEFYRYVSPVDIVNYVPFLFGYSHVGQRRVVWTRHGIEKYIKAIEKKK